MNVVVTSVSRKVSLVRSFQQALESEGSGKVIAVDSSPLAAALYFADEHFLVPRDDHPKYLDSMLAICKRCEVKLLIPSRDEELPFFAEHGDEFSAIGTKVIVAELPTIGICQDKKSFVEFCLRNGFSTPKTYDETCDIPDNEFPVFLKPQRGKGGAQTFRIDSRDELEFTLRRVPDAIIQEFVSRPEYTIDLLADFSGNILSVIPRSRIHTLAGESFVSKTVKDFKLIEGASRLSTSLGLIGHNTIQCFYDGKTIEFIEVNPRFGGGASLGFIAGVSTPRLLVKMINGEKIVPLIGEFEDQLVMLRYTEDLFLDQQALTAECSE